MTRFVGVVALCLPAAGGVAGMLETVTIDFDDQPGGIPPVISDGAFSPHATFSTQAGSVLLIFNGAGTVGGSDPNSLTAGTAPDAQTFDSDIYVDFTVAVQNLRLDVLADNDAGVVAGLRVMHAGGMTLLDVVGNGNFADPIATDLSSFEDVTRIELVDVTDEFGLAVDNLVFDVPAPGGVALLAAGALAGTRRRRG